MSEAGSPPDGRKDSPELHALETRQRAERLNQARAHRAVRDEQAQRLQRQKDATAHYFETADGKRQMRGAVRGEDASRPDGKIVSHGFNAHGNGPAEQQKLRDAQARQKAFQRQQQEQEKRRQEALELKDRAARDVDRSGKDDRGR